MSPTLHPILSTPRNSPLKQPGCLLLSLPHHAYRVLHSVVADGADGADKELISILTMSFTNPTGISVIPHTRWVI